MAFQALGTLRRQAASALTAILLLNLSGAASADPLNPALHARFVDQLIAYAEAAAVMDSCGMTLGPE